MTAAPDPQRILLVTGLSGAGKSTVLKTLEDLGWETVDNLPLSLLEPLLATPPLGRAPSAARPLAIGLDSRTRGFDAERLVQQIKAVGERQARLGRDALSRLRGAGAAAPLFRDPAAPSARARPPGDRRHRRGARTDRAAEALGRPCHRHHRQRRPNALQQQIRDRFATGD